MSCGSSEVKYRVYKDSHDHWDEITVRNHCKRYNITSYLKVTKSFETDGDIEKECTTFERIFLRPVKAWPPLGEVDSLWGRHPGNMDDGNSCLRGKALPGVFIRDIFSPDPPPRRRVIAGFDNTVITDAERHLIWGAKDLLKTTEALLDREAAKSGHYQEWDWRNGQPRKEAQTLWDEDYAALWDDLAYAVRKARGTSDSEDYTW